MTQANANTYALGLVNIYLARTAQGAPYGVNGERRVTAKEFLAQLTPADTLFEHCYDVPASNGVRVVLDLRFGDLTVTIGRGVATYALPDQFLDGLAAELGI